ncbi:site-specific integrase [Acidovorax sp. NCPPB 3576]|uniref:site-specific integrase n=1 Tax=Acidovorax sp. NCPPB 3576 TaxID=2940488 RepID=UPI002349FFEC|nr:site-specific integrase [Acidovorax sp. NCPPB 3576]WCM90509.1 site-specific integrase [Acidovorax sp. NCPPB 3576]
MRLPALNDCPALNPAELSSATEDAVNELLREGESANTIASYRSALRYWAAWFVLRYGVNISLPLPASAVVQFIVDHAERTTAAGLRHELPKAIDDLLVKERFKGKPGPMALNTLVHRIAVLSKSHQLHDFKNPCQDPKVRELLAKTRRAYGKRGDIAHKQDAITREPLVAMLETCDDSLRGRRDRALLLFAWATGGRRRSEVTSADMKCLRRTGPDSLIYTLAHSKTNQNAADRPENQKPIEGQAAQALETWLRVSGISEGAIFRQVRKGGHLGAPLSPASVRDIVRDRARMAGLPEQFSAHSLRSGFVTEAAIQGVPLSDTMAMTGHRSVASVLGYFRATAGNKAAKLLG